MTTLPNPSRHAYTTVSVEPEHLHCLVAQLPSGAYHVEFVDTNGLRVISTGNENLNGFRRFALAILDACETAEIEREAGES
jgi:hypothetical protein